MKSKSVIMTSALGSSNNAPKGHSSSWSHCWDAVCNSHLLAAGCVHLVAVPLFILVPHDVMTAIGVAPSSGGALFVRANTAGSVLLACLCFKVLFYPFVFSSSFASRLFYFCLPIVCGLLWCIRRRTSGRHSLHASIFFSCLSASHLSWFVPGPVFPECIW